MGKSNRNPVWSRDELILALNLYFKHKPTSINKNHPEILKLSELLNKLSSHVDKADEVRFRNPNGVYMKLCNFLKYDPSYKGVGLRQGSKLEETIWNEYYNKREELSIIAEAITQNINDSNLAEMSTDEDEVEFPEGKILYRKHKIRERNSSIVKKVKEKALKESKLICEVCDFDFYKFYGKIGYGFIECHHDVPISTYGYNSSTKINDLRLVCSNCHRILHRKRPWLSVNELRELRKNLISANMSL